MSEVERVCQRVAVLRAGRMVAMEPIDALKARAHRRLEVTFTTELPPTITIPGVTEIERRGKTIRFDVAENLDGLMRTLAPMGIGDLRTTQPSLEEVLMTWYREDQP